MILFLLALFYFSRYTKDCGFNEECFLNQLNKCSDAKYTFEPIEEEPATEDEIQTSHPPEAIQKRASDYDYEQKRLATATIINKTDDGCIVWFNYAHQKEAAVEEENGGFFCNFKSVKSPKDVFENYEDYCK